MGQFAAAISDYSKILDVVDTPFVRIERAKAHTWMDDIDLAAEDYRAVVFSRGAEDSEREEAASGLNELGLDSVPLKLPSAIVAEFYSDLSSAGLSSTNPYFTRSLAELLAEDEQRDYAVLDFDPIVDGQDASISDLSIMSEWTDMNREPLALVYAEFLNFGEPKKVVYHFVEEDNIWKLLNITIRDWSLMTDLESAPPATPSNDDVSDAYEKGVDAFNRGDFETAFDSLSPGAVQGDPKSQYHIGLMYRQGNGVLQSAEEAANWFRRAAAQGHVTAQTNLGVMYRDGEGVSVDKHEAMYWYTLAAEQGDPFSQTELGIFYRVGIVVEKDIDQAVHWFTLAAEQDYVYAQNQLGLLYYLDPISHDPEMAARWFETASRLQYAPAQFNLAMLHQIGEGATLDTDRAKELYDIAAAQGIQKPSDKPSELLTYDVVFSELFLKCDELAAHPYDSNGPSDGEWGVSYGDINAPEAITACHRAVDQYPNIARFKYQLGRAYNKAGSYELSYQWYERAAAMDHAQALSGIAFLYRDGEGVEADIDEERGWHIRAANRGSITSMHELGEMYRTGKGVAFKNLDAALEYHLRAAEGGHVDSFKYAAQLLEDHSGDYSAAFTWYEAAAAEGDAYSTMRTAIFFALGRGVSVSPVNAAYYMIEAAKTGDSGVMKTLMNTDNRWGEDVISELQRQLADLGLYSGRIDGDYGPKTRRALQIIADG